MSRSVSCPGSGRPTRTHAPAAHRCGADTSPSLEKLRTVAFLVRGYGREGGQLGLPLDQLRATEHRLGRATRRRHRGRRLERIAKCLLEVPDAAVRTNEAGVLGLEARFHLATLISGRDQLQLESRGLSHAAWSRGRQRRRAALLEVGNDPLELRLTLQVKAQRLLQRSQLNVCRLNATDIGFELRGQLAGMTGPERLEPLLLGVEPLAGIHELFVEERAGRLRDVATVLDVLRDEELRQPIGDAERFLRARRLEPDSDGRRVLIFRITLSMVTVVSARMRVTTSMPGSCVRSGRG